MKYEKFLLSDRVPFLKELGSVATVEVYSQDSEMEMYESYPKPGMVVCPGSGYAKCAKREAEPVAIRLLGMNFQVFVLTYSCAPLRYPIQLLEVAALFSLIHQNQKEWDVDPDKVGIMGFSAGGHLAANYSCCFDGEEIKQYFKENYRPCMAVLGYPVISADLSILNTDSFEQLLGHHPEGEEGKKYSCEYLVSSKTPPTFIWHTAEDQCVFVENSLRYATALSRNKIPYTMHIYPHGEHGLSTLDDLTCNALDAGKGYGGDWMDQLKQWIKIIL